ncbi:MAG: hypothetical protein KOO60_05890 [Gemmatimonadales bacterium]|nr:hypothetical protein [Gemmatimonadales bacterium]
MRTSARISFSEMTALMEKMPRYTSYRTDDRAAEAERSFRRALGTMLKECGDRLLTIAEKQSQLLSSEQEVKIDGLVDRIGMIFRRLDREGDVCLVGHCDNTIHELEELDTRLILIIEKATELVRKLESGIPANIWFKTEADLLGRDLSIFSEMTEERNYLLGLGWESEFTWPGRESL